MTRHDFIRYLAAPENLNVHSLPDLERLVHDYPYFQTARLLFLKNLHNENSIAYEKNLHITSAYAPGGKVLYNLIKKKPQVLSPKSQEPGLEPQTAQAVDTTEYAADNELPKEVVSAALGKQPTREITASEKINDLPRSEDVTEKKDEYDELQLLEKEMLRETYRTSMTVDLLKATEEEEAPAVTIKTRKDKHKPSDLRHSASETYSFTDWMKVISDKTHDTAVEEKALQKKQKTDLIDKFILEEAVKITPKPKVEFYSAEAMAKKSILDDETFVSETLASIYLKQGNLQKALRAYEILGVKYPEKIHIFAPLLEKLKKLLQEQKHK